MSTDIATDDPQGNDRTAYTSAYPSKRDPRVDEVETGQNKGSTKSAAGGGVNIGDIERLISAGVGVGMIACALTENKSNALVSAIAGGALLFRGLTGQCQLYRVLGINTAKSDGTTVAAGSGYKVEGKIIVRRSPDELYRFWRNFENLPRIMDHLKEVKELGGNRSHWVASTALGEIAWDAEVFNERENEMIAWRSMPGSIIDTAGSVRFNQLLPSGHTEVVVNLKYNPPLGAVGAQIESWLGGSLQKRMAADLRRFKESMEAGEGASPPEFAQTSSER
jgi:uncharacterized membrane protein